MSHERDPDTRARIDARQRELGAARARPRPSARRCARRARRIRVWVAAGDRAALRRRLPRRLRAARLRSRPGARREAPHAAPRPAALEHRRAKPRSSSASEARIGQLESGSRIRGRANPTPAKRRPPANRNPANRARIRIERPLAAQRPRSRERTRRSSASTASAAAAASSSTGDGPPAQRARTPRDAPGERLLELARAASPASCRDSELSRLNADPRERVPVSPLMARLAATAREAAERHRRARRRDAARRARAQAGYGGELPPRSRSSCALALAPAAPARGPSPGARLARSSTSTRSPRSVAPPAGPDARQRRAREGPVRRRPRRELSARTRASPSTAPATCAIGGAGRPRARGRGREPVRRERARTRSRSRAGGVATSGIGRRSWLGADGRPAHHLLDPATGRPAFTGIVQATALAPSAVLAEIHAKAAVLSGPARRRRWLPWGGVLVLDDGSHRFGCSSGRHPAGRWAEPLARPRAERPCASAGRPNTASLPARSSAPPSPNAAASCGVSSSAGSGREKKKPWPISQPVAAPGTRASSSLSMPSATTVRPRLRARSIVERTIASVARVLAGCR